MSLGATYEEAIHLNWSEATLYIATRQEYYKLQQQQSLITSYYNAVNIGNVLSGKKLITPDEFLNTAHKKAKTSVEKAYMPSEEEITKYNLNMVVSDEDLRRATILADPVIMGLMQASNVVVEYK